jgi:hypothetical protein
VQSKLPSLDQQCAYESKSEPFSSYTSLGLDASVLTHPPVAYCQAGMEIQAMTASSLVESGLSQAEDTSNEDRTVSGDTERIPTPDLDEIVKGIRSRNQNSPACWFGVGRWIQQLHKGFTFAESERRHRRTSKSWEAFLAGGFKQRLQLSFREAISPFLASCSRWICTVTSSWAFLLCGCKGR